MTGVTGRAFVVTGGASGIGLAVARLARERGARVAVLDRDAEALRRLTAETGGSVHALVCDVADAASVNAAIDAAAQALGGIDALVHSAGVDHVASLAGITDAEWERTFAVNLGGPMRVNRAALPHLKRSGSGTIVHIASAAGLAPLAGRSAYCASKAGLVMFGKALAMELAPDGIRVNAVCPGAVDTPLFRTSYEHAADPAAAFAAIEQRYALHRIAQPAELAEAVLFLSSPASSYVTGAALAVDGGRSYH